MNFIEICDAVPRSLFLKARDHIFSDNFPWYYVAATAYTDDVEKYETAYNGSFYHLAMNNGMINSEIGHILESCFMVAMDKTGISFNKLRRIRIGLIPICPINNVNPPHIDMESPHRVALWYLNESDGDTVLYNERYDLNYEKRNCGSYYREVLNQNVTINRHFQPEENKMIVFDGLTYHSSSTPKETKRRIAVNYVFD